MEKKGSKYLVKWENYPEEQNTWEPRSAIPKEIIEKYEMDQESSTLLGNQAKTLGKDATPRKTETKREEVTKKDALIMFQVT